MLGALVAGERDRKVLAELAQGKLRTKLPLLRQALRAASASIMGCWSGWRWTTREHLEAAIARSTPAWTRCWPRWRWPVTGSATSTGVGKRAAEMIGAEIGVDLSVFPTAGHLACWAGRCPGNNLTGGKRRSGKPTKGNHWLADVGTECAWAAARSRGTYLAAQLLAAGPPHRQAEGRHGRRPPRSW